MIKRRLNRVTTMSRIILLSILFLSVIPLLATSSCVKSADLSSDSDFKLEPDWIVWSPAEAELLQGSHERIEEYRKGVARIEVVDYENNRVRDAAVHVEMVEHDFLFGSNLFQLGCASHEVLENVYRQEFLNLFNYATLPFYWDFYESAPGKVEELKLQGLIDYAREHGLVTYGHPLLWTQSVPSWVPLDQEQTEAVLHQRVAATMGRFRGLVDFWDVVNEPTLAPRFETPVGKWMKSIGSAGAVAIALDWARKADPEAKLIINDFRTDDAYYDLLKEIQKSGGEFGAVGIQTHMHAGNYPLEQVWAICERFKELGVPLQFTEMTVLSGDLKTGSDWNSHHDGWKTTPDGENIQAAYVEAVYRILFSHPAVQAITWWDFSDLCAWQGAPAGLLREDMTPKPAYYRLVNLIRGEWWTNMEITTDSGGRAKFSGFYGTYRLVAEKNGQRSESIVRLKRGEKNAYRLQLGAN